MHRVGKVLVSARDRAGGIYVMYTYGRSGPSRTGIAVPVTMPVADSRPKCWRIKGEEICWDPRNRLYKYRGKWSSDEPAPLTERLREMDAGGPVVEFGPP